MYRLTLFTLFLFIYGASEARMPKGLSKILGIGENSRNAQSSMGNLKDDLNNDPGTFMGRDFDMDKYIANAPSNIAPIETARSKLDAGDVAMNMPTMVIPTECYVELLAGNLKDYLKEDPGTFMGMDFDMDKYRANAPSDIASIETARRKRDAGDVAMYMQTMSTAAECHVEFQVSERVPGRCIRLAGNIPACQGEKYIGINYNECS